MDIYYSNLAKMELYFPEAPSLHVSVGHKRYLDWDLEGESEAAAIFLYAGRCGWLKLLHILT